MKKKLLALIIVGIISMSCFVIVPISAKSITIENNTYNNLETTEGNTIIVLLKGNVNGMPGAIATLDWHNGGGLDQEVTKGVLGYSTTFTGVGSDLHFIDVTLAVEGYKVSEQKEVFFKGFENGIETVTFGVTKSRSKAVNHDIFDFLNQFPMFEKLQLLLSTILLN